ncbi:MAG: EF-hand domain-containing protein [Desulfovibrio sp.]
MDISGIGSSTLSSLSPEILAQMRNQSQGGSSEEFASSFVNDKDSDSDGLLSLTEAGIDQSMFETADADGDGYLTQEEIAADVEARKQETDKMMGGLNMLMQGMDGSEQTAGMSFADSLISESDADGDGALNLEESGLSEDLFEALDTDGDGSITTEELDAAMQPPDGMATGTELSGETIASAATASGTASTTAASETEESSSSSSSSDEEYDEYDLNEDGVVTMDELRQAFANGDISLESLFQDQTGGNEAETGNNSQSALLRTAMRAYQAQGMDMSSVSQSAVA